MPRRPPQSDWATAPTSSACGSSSRPRWKNWKPAAGLSRLNENDNGSDKLNDIYRAVIGLPDRSRVAKQLAETLRIAIDLERREFGMDKTQVNTDPLTELIKRICTSNGSAFTPVAVDPAYSGGDE